MQGVGGIWLVIADSGGDRSIHEQFVNRLPAMINDQRLGQSKEEARQSLVEAIALIFEDRRKDGLRAVPPDAGRETVVVT